MLISIIIPAYNEEKRIKNTLETILDYTKNYDSDVKFEIIVVDDGSKDMTAHIVNEYQQIKLLKQEPNQGKGFAIKRGMLEANGELRLFTDADLSTPIIELKKLILEIENGFDIAIGSRALDKNLIKIRQPFYREFMGKTFNFMVKKSINTKIKDTQCGFKLFKKDAATKIFSVSKLSGFSFDVEVVYLANLLGFKINEVPVLWENSTLSKVDPIKDSIRMFLDILKIKSFKYF